MVHEILLESRAFTPNSESIIMPAKFPSGEEIARTTEEVDSDHLAIATITS